MNFFTKAIEALRGTGLAKRAGEVVAASFIATDVEQRKAAEAALLESEARFRELADAMPQIVWTTGPDGVIDYVNRRWEEISGSRIIGNDAWKPVVHPDDWPPAATLWAESLQSGAPFEMNLRLLDQRSGGYRWHLMRTLPVRHDDGPILRWYGTATDVHEQKRSGDAAMFLAEASAALASLVDYESTLQKLVSMAVPRFADWAAADVEDKARGRRRIAVAHEDPEKVHLVKELLRRYPKSFKERGGASAVFRTGEPQLVEKVNETMLRTAAEDEEHLRLIRALGLRSYMAVPLTLGGETFAVLTFATSESGRIFSRAELSVAEDLARRASVSIENARLYQALRDEDRRKTEFIAVLAHELRNPLAPLRSGLEVMRTSGGDHQSVEHVRLIMERQVEHLVRLVDDLLDVSRISSGAIELRRERVTMAAVVEEAIETCEPILKAQGDELTVTLPDRQIYLDGDRTRLAQALCNLVNNAVKYSEPGSRIWLQAKQEGNCAVIRVRDSGVGIPPETLSQVFDLFMQGDKSLEKLRSGLGVGLTIVRQLVEMHGGSVEAHSEGLGKGSEFVVRLPIVPPPANEAGSEQHDQSFRPAINRRVLVVDDNADAAATMEMLLAKMGNDVRTAHDGKQAIEAAAAFRPDLILMDIGMPHLNGYEACRRIREMPWGQKLTIIALTGWGHAGDKERSKLAGFDGHLVKPIGGEALEGLLANVKPESQQRV